MLEVIEGFRTVHVLNNDQFGLIKVAFLLRTFPEIDSGSLNLRMDRLILKGGKASGISSSFREQAILCLFILT